MSAPSRPVHRAGALQPSLRFVQLGLGALASRIPVRPPPFWQGQLIAIGCTAGGAGLRIVLTPVAHNHIPVVIFYPFVLIASIWGGAAAGIMVWVLGTIVAINLWLPVEGREITLTAFSLVCLFGVLLASLLRAVVELHAEGEARAVLLAHELKHRGANLLMVVQAISAQSARNAKTMSEYQSTFEPRLAALARAQQIVSETPDAPPDLGVLVRHLIAPFGSDRFAIRGPECLLPRETATPLALLLHELGTNATKYGALSAPGGSVSIEWDCEVGGIRLEWRELGGPPVSKPSRAGFGSRLFKQAFSPEHGSASIHYEPDGLRCTAHLNQLEA